MPAIFACCSYLFELVVSNVSSTAVCESSSLKWHYSGSPAVAIGSQHSEWSKITGVSPVAALENTQTLWSTSCCVHQFAGKKQWKTWQRTVISIQTLLSAWLPVRALTAKLAPCSLLSPLHSLHFDYVWAKLFIESSIVLLEKHTHTKQTQANKQAKTTNNHKSNSWLLLVHTVCSFFFFF